MRKILFLFCLLLPVAGLAQDAATSSDANAAPAVTPLPMPTPGQPIPWDAWFKDNATVNDKTDYVYFFLNAQDFKAYFTEAQTQARLAQAAVEMVSRLYPSDAKADTVKVDIVYILERDSYGMPKWDSLQKVAHFEFLRSKALEWAKKKAAFTPASIKKFFTQAQFF